MVDDDHFLIDLYRAVIHFADADTSHVFVIVDGADEDLGARVGIALGCGNVLDDGVKERCHVFSLDRKLRGGSAGLCGGVDEGAVKLFVVGIQIHEKLQHFVHYLDRPCFGTIAFIDAYNHGQIEFQRLF